MKPVSSFHQLSATKLKYRPGSNIISAISNFPAPLEDNLLWRHKYDLYAAFGILEISLPCTKVTERSNSWSDLYRTETH